MRWKLGLRNPATFDISKLGIKCLYLSRNHFGDYFCEQLSAALKADEYLKCIYLRKNNIKLNGIKCLAEAVFQHPSLTSIDLRDNPCDKDKEARNLKMIMVNSYFKNLNHDFKVSLERGHRVNSEYMVPEVLGVKKNHLDDVSSQITPHMRRVYFEQLISHIARHTPHKWSHILKSIMGPCHDPKKQELKKQIEALRKP